MPPEKSEANSEQYSSANVAAYESVYGRDFLSPGGPKLAAEFARMLELKPDERVLDVGSGLGGCACLIAQEFGAKVDGLDLSPEMVSEATARCQDKKLSDLVQFHQKDCLKLEVEEQYDAVFSRDVFLHIADKERLFTNLYRALKPGGRVLFTDYCCGSKPWPWSFNRYVTTRGYTLHTQDEYTDLLKLAGFHEVVGKDITPLFIETLTEELTRIGRLPWQKRPAFNLGWRSKLRSARKGAQRWGLFRALKPGCG